MMFQWGLWALAAVAAGALLVGWVMEERRHAARLRKVPIRVHVNGIRGKSTITRYIAAALNAGGFSTVGKTTGSATRLIAADGTETPVRRIGAPTILEQITLLADAIRPDTDALVVECMALNPEYQRISETRMIRATDGIIANVRHDHMEQLGDALPRIARSLASTAPRDGILYTAVQDDNLIDVLREEAHGEVIQVSPRDISHDELDRFGPMAVAENIALALAVATRHGIARETALQAMVDARPDPGASTVERIEAGAGVLHWVDLFSINDVASASKVLHQIRSDLDDLPVVLMLNTRSDRTARSADFADWIGSDLPGVTVVETGNATDAAAARLDRHGANESGAFHIGSEEDRADLVQRLLDMVGAEEAIAVGLANIHSQDAERLKDRFEDAA